MSALDDARAALIEGVKLEARNAMRHDPRVWHEALESALDKTLPGFWDAARAAGAAQPGDSWSCDHGCTAPSAVCILDHKPIAEHERLTAPPTEDDREALRRVMTEQGFDDGGAHPHSWRCEHPDRFPDYCTCVNEMSEAILAAGYRKPGPVTDAAVAVMAAIGCEAYEDEGECLGCDASIVSCSHPPFVYCETHDEAYGVGEHCPVAVAALEAARAADTTHEEENH